MKRRSDSRIRVFLVDDHPIVRAGVRSYLSDQRSIEVIGEASDAKEALQKLKSLAPDVIVLDVNLPVMDGGELALRLRQMIPHAKLLAFSVHSSEEYVLRMARCGVHGYVMKDRPPVQLLDAILVVSQDGLYFPAGMNAAVAAARAQHDSDAASA